MGVDKSERPNKTTLSLKAKQQVLGEGIPPSVKDAINDIVDMRSMLFTMLKVVTIASLADDEVSEDFFSDFDNYSAFSAKSSNIGILPKDAIVDESTFSRNPASCWMKIVIALFVALYSFPDNSRIFCDTLASAGVESNSLNKAVGTYFSTMLRLEAFDCEEHKVDLYIPNSVNERSLFIVDDEPVMYDDAMSTGGELPRS